MALDKDLLAKVKAGFKKQAFVPAGGDPAAQGGGQQVDPATGMPIDPATGMPIDPNTGMPIDPNTGMPIDPSTGMPIDPSMMGGGMPPQGGMPPPPPAGDPAAAGAPPPPAGGEEMSPEGEPYIKLTFSQLLAAFDKISKLAQKINGGAPAQPQAQPAPDNGNQALADEVKDLKNMLMSALS